MWWKMLLLCIYGCVLFVFARMLEAMVWYETGYISSRFIDPWTLSVRKLKLLLDRRGVSYHGVLEKRELSELISATGDVMDGEMDTSLDDEDETTVVSRNFTGEAHFFEEVEDRKDSVWIIHVKGENQPPLLSNSDWNLLIKKVAKFGVRSGIFDCSHDWRLCSRKNWYTSRLILALPQGFKAKDNVMLRNYKGASKVNSVFEWINRNVASRVKMINDYNELRKDWLSFGSAKRKAEMRVLYFSHIEPPPIFLSLLSVEFTGRAKFGTINIRSREGKNILNRLKQPKIPRYMILTNGKNYTYGSHPGEYIGFSAMGLFLRSLYPETNDVFIFSLLVINLCCLLEFFIRQGGLLIRSWKSVICLGKYNVVLLLLWLPTLGVLQFPSADRFIDNILHYFRFFSGSALSSLIRADFLHPIFSLPWLILSFIIYGLIIGMIEYKRTGGVEENPVSNEWWSGVWDDYTNYLFQPMATLTRPMSPQDLDLEEGMELLIERLAVPDLWLHPRISTDYVKDLPIWLYTGKSDNTSSDDFLSDTDGYESESPQDQLKNEKPHNETKQPGSFLTGLSQESCVKLVMDGNYKCTCGQNPGTAENKNSCREKAEASKANIKNEKSNKSPKPSINGAPPGMLYSTECVICLESYRYGTPICGLPCGHSFHESCILEWLSRDHHWCPLCRWPSYKQHPCKVRSVVN